MPLTAEQIEVWKEDAAAGGASALGSKLRAELEGERPERAVRVGLPRLRIARRDEARNIVAELVNGIG